MAVMAIGRRFAPRREPRGRYWPGRRAAELSARRTRTAAPARPPGAERGHERGNARAIVLDGPPARLSAPLRRDPGGSDAAGRAGPRFAPRRTCEIKVKLHACQSPPRCVQRTNRGAAVRARGRSRRRVTNARRYSKSEDRLAALLLLARVGGEGVSVALLGAGLRCVGHSVVDAAKLADWLVGQALAESSGDGRQYRITPLGSIVASLRAPHPGVASEMPRD